MIFTNEMVKYGLENTLLVNKCRLNECEMRMGLVTRLGKDSSRKYEHSTQRSSLNGFEDFPCVRQRDQCIFWIFPCVLVKIYLNLPLS